MDENMHCSFGSYSSDIYCPPPSRDFTTKLMESIENFDDAYSADDFLYFFPETLLYCSEKLHLQSYLDMLWSKTVYFGLLGNNLIMFIILLYLIER